MKSSEDDSFNHSSGKIIMKDHPNLKQPEEWTRHGQRPEDWNG
jgi:hypothetical protein